jgi:hypothetical protein
MGKAGNALQIGNLYREISNIITCNLQGCKEFKENPCYYSRKKNCSVCTVLHGPVKPFESTQS